MEMPNLKLLQHVSQTLHEFKKYEKGILLTVHRNIAYATVQRTWPFHGTFPSWKVLSTMDCSNSFSSFMSLVVPGNDFQEYEANSGIWSGVCVILADWLPHEPFLPFTVPAHSMSCTNNIIPLLLVTPVYNCMQKNALFTNWPTL